MNNKCGFVSLIGFPNSGKSTLLNSLVNEKISIVSPKAQTTRRNIRGIVEYNNSQAIYIDTPGICYSNSNIEKALLKNFRLALKDSDIIILLIDSSQKFNLKRFSFIENKQFINKHFAIAINKIDLLQNKEKLLEIAAQLSKFDFIKEIFFISALNGEGIEPLKRFVENSLPESPWLYMKDHFSTDLDLNFRLAEITREKLFENLEQELPYSLYVTTEALHITDKKLKIMQTIVVLKDSHKKIIIGYKGNTIKKIKFSAIREMKNIFTKNIELKLFVKVREKWTEKKEHMINAGII